MAAPDERSLSTPFPTLHSSPSRGALLLPSIASQLTTANAAVEKGKLRRTVPTAEEVLGLALALETTIGSCGARATKTTYWSGDKHPADTHHL